MDSDVKERFDNASKEYVTERYIWRYRSAQLVSKLVSPNINDIVLDIGCVQASKLLSCLTI